MQEKNMHIMYKIVFGEDYSSSIIFKKLAQNFFIFVSNISNFVNEEIKFELYCSTLYNFLKNNDRQLKSSQGHSGESKLRSLGVAPLNSIFTNQIS